MKKEALEAARLFNDRVPQLSKYQNESLKALVDYVLAQSEVVEDSDLRALEALKKYTLQLHEIFAKCESLPSWLIQNEIGTLMVRTFSVEREIEKSIRDNSAATNKETTK